MQDGKRNNDNVAATCRITGEQNSRARIASLLPALVIPALPFCRKFIRAVRRVYRVRSARAIERQTFRGSLECIARFPSGEFLSFPRTRRIKRDARLSRPRKKNGKSPRVDTSFIGNFVRYAGGVSIRRSPSATP